MGIKLFKEDFNNINNMEFVNYNAGLITNDGTIAFNQIAAEETFSVGMPIYSAKTGEYIGRLSAGNYSHLDIELRDGLDNPIPATKWFVEGYKGERKYIKTYWQMLKEKNLIDMR